MLGGRSWDDWIGAYAAAHRDPRNRLCHTFGIPAIVVSLALLALAPFVAGLWVWAVALFVCGWALQFAGHVFEGTPPEFFKDWRFLLVGLRWWFAKIGGRA
jgi:uncharacterized membrane protein YGL010W